MSLASDSQNSSEARIISGTADKLQVVVARVYAQCWAEYREWHLENANQALSSLLTRHNAFLPPLPPQNTPLPATPGIWEVTDHNAQETYCLATEKGTTEAVPRYASYESCTPASRNIMVGDDPDYLPFIPFADDSTYVWQFDNNQYGYFAWEEENNVDLEVVLHDTLQKLTADFGISHADIDATGELPMSCSAIRKMSRSRDFPKWTPHKIDAITKSLTPGETIDYFLENFCSNLNCIQSFCYTHLTISPPNRRKPQRREPSKPCDNLCSVLSTAPSLPRSDSDHAELVLSTLERSREAMPCDVATICRIPCHQVSEYWPPAASSPDRPVLPDKSTHKYKENSDVYVPRLPCKHRGLCNASAGCTCFDNKAHCHTRCGCDQSCLRRWKGCACASITPGGTCSTKSCPCFKAHRECDPEVCLSCESRDSNSKACQNVAIQRGKHKTVKVEESIIGLGLFVLEPCEKDEMIAEYVGELVLLPTTNSRDGIAGHLGRSYVFDINRDFSIDSMKVGNGTRYINHSHAPNCYTKVCLVNNEHRVGVFAGRRIAAGQELYIDYGPRFFDTRSKVAKSKSKQAS